MASLLEQFWSGGQVVYRGHGVHAWDAAEGSFLSYWFDNIGVVQKSPHRAKLEGSTYGYISSGGPMGHSRFTYTFEGDRLDFTIDTSRDAHEWKPMHEGRYLRQR
mgnify:CR=1 FL=1